MTTKLGKQLYDDYGYVIFPKGFTFYHCSNNEIELSNSKNFNFTFFLTIGKMFFWNKNKHLYKFTLLQDYKVLFCIKKLFRCKSALLDIAEKYLNITFSDRSYPFIKQCSSERNKYINALKDNGIYGILSDIENNPLIEICLFTEKYNNYYTIEKINKNDVINSLNIYNPYVFIGNKVDFTNYNSTNISYKIKLKKEMEKEPDNHLFQIYRLVQNSNINL